MGGGCDINRFFAIHTATPSNSKAFWESHEFFTCGHPFMFFFRVSYVFQKSILK